MKLKVGQSLPTPPASQLLLLRKLFPSRGTAGTATIRRSPTQKSHPPSWSFDLRHHPLVEAGQESVKGGGRVQPRGAWGHPGPRALPLPGPSAVGRGLEPSCPAGSGRRLDALIRPQAIFAARRVRNPGLGRLLLARLGKLREGKSGRLGRRLLEAGTRPASRRSERLQRRRAGDLPRRGGRRLGTHPARAPRAAPPGALTHRCRQRRGSRGF